MMAVVLTILKIIGITLLVLLGIVILLLILVLFVPIRYKITAQRKLSEEPPHKAIVKIGWLLHIFRLTFSYPEASYFRLRIFFITIFRSDKPRKPYKVKKAKSTKKEEELKPEETQKTEEPPKSEESNKQEGQISEKETLLKTEAVFNKETESKSESETEQKTELQNSDDSQQKKKKHKFRDKVNSIIEFFKKIWKMLKNIQYTIHIICDKIKYIVKNIKYYLEILKSEEFGRAWMVGSGQVMKLIKHIRPQKIKGSILVGTGDPASTGQILSIFGILYPFIGSNITVTPDFEQTIFEGDLLVKGRITVYKLLKTGLIVYLNQDIKQVINSMKREAV